MRSVFLLILLFSVAVCGMAESRVTDRVGIRDGLSNNFVTDIAQDGYGFLWIATDNGLNRFDGERFIVFDEKSKTLNGNSIDAIYYDYVAEYIWVGTKKGVNIIDCRTLRNVDLHIPEEIAGYSVADFTPDGEGGIYLLGKYGFIAHFDRKQACWHIFREADFKGLVMSMFSAATTPDGLLAAGQENYGLSLIDIKKRTFENHMHNAGQTGSLPGNNVRSLLVSRDGNLYVGTEHGAARFDSASHTFAPVELSDVRGRNTGNGNITSLTEIADGTILASIGEVVFQDSFGNIWIGTDGKGLEFIPSTPPLLEKASMSPGYVGPGFAGKAVIPAAILPMVRNKTARIASMARIGSELLVSVADDGIFSIDEKTGTAARIPTPYDKDFANTIITSGDTVALLGTQRGLYEYRNSVLRRNEKISAATGYLVPNGILTAPDGNLWVGTYGNGIFIFDKNDRQLAHLTTDTGLASDAVKQLLLDSHNRVWVGAQDGLSVISDFRRPDGIRNFNYDNGLPDISIRSLVEDAEGNIWLASNNLLCRYNASGDSIESFGGRIKLTESSFLDREAARSDNGTIYFGTPDGIYAFHPGNIDRRKKYPELRIVGYVIPGSGKGGEDSGITRYNPGATIDIPYGCRMVKILFAVPDFSMRGKTAYYYRLDGESDRWLPLPESHELMLANLSAGHYLLRVRPGTPADVSGNESNELQLEITVKRPWWLMWWAIAAYILLGGAIVCLVLRYGRNRRNEAPDTETPSETLTATTHTAPELSQVDREFLDHFTSLVEQNMGRADLDMEFLQAELGMSHSTLYRRLKALTGMSGNEFIRKCRLRKGHEMLCQGFSVSETAYACGFSDPGYFRTCFKSEYGVAPSELKKTIR